MKCDINLLAHVFEKNFQKTVTMFGINPFYFVSLAI